MTDQTRMPDRTLSEFTAQLASASPAPGGGGAAALTGALAASLAAMAANVTAANPRYAERTDALATLAAACDAQRTALLTLIDADAAGFLPLQRAYAIPKTDPERAAALAVAARPACQAPLDMLAPCREVALLLAAVSILLFLPILLTYLDTGLVPRFPTLIVSGFIMVAALQSLFCGLLLDNMRQKDCRDFEFQLQQAHDSYRRMQERA